MSWIQKLNFQWLTLSNTEKNGTLFFSSFLLLTIVFRIVISVSNTSSENFVSVEIHSTRNDYKQKSLDCESINNKDSILRDDVRLFEFDPNEISIEELKELGIPERIAKTWISFRSSGAVFSRKEDVLRIYGMDSTIFNTIKDYIYIQNKTKDEDNTYIEINSADSSELVNLKGIGKVYASRIYKYREYLGGFVCKEQLYEVYNLPEETVIKISPYLKIDTSLVRRIDLKFASYRDLYRHPYCSYNWAKKIVDYRSKEGKIENVSRLKEFITEEDDSLFLKYLKK